MARLVLLCPSGRSDGKISQAASHKTPAGSWVQAPAGRGSWAQLKDMSSPCDGLGVKWRVQGQDQGRSGNSNPFGCLATGRALAATAHWALIGWQLLLTGVGEKTG